MLMPTEKQQDGVLGINVASYAETAQRNRPTAQRISGPRSATSCQPTVSLSQPVGF